MVIWSLDDAIDTLSILATAESSARTSRPMGVAATMGSAADVVEGGLHAVLRTAGVATAIVAVTTALDVGNAAGVGDAVIAIGAERQQKLGRSMFAFPRQGGPMESH